MQQSTRNLKEALDIGLSDLEGQNIENAILVYGDAGSGKSLLEASLMFGSNFLEQKTIQKTVNLRKGVFKNKNIKVMDIKAGIQNSSIKI